VIVAAAALAAACRDSGAERPTGPDARSPTGSLATARSSDDFTRDFPLERCTFVTEGRNPYFDLTPGYTLRFTGREDGEPVALRITVLNRTLRVGGVLTRVVQELETAGGELAEVSYNYFAICKETNSVFYFGEDVDDYEDGRVVGHSGAWRHGENGARAGLMMPGLPLLGARYYQEVAPGVALDRAEVTQLDAVVRTPAGRFTDVLVTEETNELEPGVAELKFYAPDVGLLRDGPMSLVEVIRPSAGG
jgi:hypothetical protein